MTRLTALPDAPPLPEKIAAECTSCGFAGLWWPRHGVVTHEKSACRVSLTLPVEQPVRRVAA